VGWPAAWPQSILQAGRNENGKKLSSGDATSGLRPGLIVPQDFKVTGFFRSFPDLGVLETFLGFGGTWEHEPCQCLSEVRHVQSLVSKQVL
jgi:hypothetical protein